MTAKEFLMQGMEVLKWVDGHGVLFFGILIGREIYHAILRNRG